jgi:hypothetical protein
MDCRYFDGCSAPLCPKEDICRLADVPEWVKRQRKVSRKAAMGGYFTVAMLKQDCRISKGMKGVDPDGTDSERERDEAAWFTAHPVITEEERAKLRVSAEKLNAKSLGFKSKKDPSLRASDEVSGKKGIQVPLEPETPLKDVLRP